MRIRICAALVVAAFGLSACGSNPLEQGLFGAGAGTGAAVLTGGNPVTGAVIGAVGNVAYCQYVDKAKCR